MRRIAHGGMAELYLARASGPHGFEKLCVLKLVLPHLTEDRQFVEMFLHEARLAARLDHANIAHVTDIGELDGEPFFVMQYIHGRDLRAVLAALKGRRVPLDVALTIITHAAAGLHYVHQQRDEAGKPLGMIHRDISPSNIMVGYDGGTKIVDFGIAKSTLQQVSTRTGVLKGKVSYMAPEQCRAGTLDRRTDVFGLGILLYELTTSRRLFHADTDFEIMTRIVEGRYAAPESFLPDYPPALSAIIARALQVDPKERFASAEALWNALEAFADAEGLRLSTWTVRSFMQREFPDDAAGTDSQQIRVDAVAVPAKSKAPPAPSSQVSDAETESSEENGTTADAVAQPKTELTRSPRSSARVIPAPEVAPAQAPEPSFKPKRSPVLPVVMGVGAGLLLWWAGWYLFIRTDPAPQPDVAAQIENPVAAGADAAPSTTPPAPVSSNDAADIGPAPVSREDFERLTFEQRHAWLTKPNGVPVDFELQIGLDLVQAGQSPHPCRTFADALSTIENEKRAVYDWAIAKAKVPLTAPDAAVCKGLEARLAALSAASDNKPAAKARPGSKPRRPRKSDRPRPTTQPDPPPTPPPAAPIQKPKDNGVATKLDDGLRG